MRRVKASLALGVGAAFAAAFGIGVDQASAISDGNSTVETTLPASTALTTWRVDGVDHMFSTQYWIRIGSEPVDLIQSLDFGGQLGGDDLDDFVTGRWTDVANEVQVDVSISTAGGNPAQMPVSISVSSTASARNQPLAVSVYEYVDMDLNADAVDDGLSITGGNDVEQTDGGTTYEQNSAQTPTAYQRLDGSTAGGTLDALFAGNLDNSNVAPVGGDEAFAFQWDFVLDDPGVQGSGEYQIGITKSIRTEQVIPEPATTALGMLGLSGLAGYLGRRRRQA